jgi:hypothetical protein
MSVDDLNPSARPFSAKIDQLSRDPAGLACPAAASLVFEYLDLAKRALLEARVRDFTAADVVAVAAIMESRDRARLVA